MSQPTPATVAQIHKPTHSYVHVTPEIAQRWLANNTANRTVRRAKVNQYANDMAAGRWTISNDDLCFTTDGVLQNGQHRLLAVIQSGATVIMGVKRNVPREAMQNMDSGAARTAADALAFNGESNTHLLAAMAKLCILIEDGRIYKDNKVQAISHSEIQEWIDANPSARAVAQGARRVRGQIDAPPSAIGAAMWLIASTAGWSVAEFYFDQLSTRNNEPAGSAVLAVDSRLREIRRSRSTYPTRNYIYLLIKGWNYYAEDRSVRSLAMSPKGEFALPKVSRWTR